MKKFFLNRIALTQKFVTFNDRLMLKIHERERMRERKRERESVRADVRESEIIFA